MKIDISKFKKETVLATLYNHSKPQGLGILHFDPKAMEDDEAKELLKRQSYFDYLKGRVMKVDLSGDELDARLYDRDNGDGAAQRAIDRIPREVFTGV